MFLAVVWDVLGENKNYFVEATDEDYPAFVLGRFQLWIGLQVIVISAFYC